MQVPTPSEHPNATTAAGGGGVGILVVWLLGNVLHIDLSAEVGAAIASGIGTIVLLIGKNGLAGIAKIVWHGKG